MSQLENAFRGVMPRCTCDLQLLLHTIITRIHDELRRRRRRQDTVAKQQRKAINFRVEFSSGDFPASCSKLCNWRVPWCVVSDWREPHNFCRRLLNGRLTLSKKEPLVFLMRRYLNGQRKAFQIGTPPRLLHIKSSKRIPVIKPHWVPRAACRIVNFAHSKRNCKTDDQNLRPRGVGCGCGCCTLCIIVIVAEASHAMGIGIAFEIGIAL